MKPKERGNKCGVVPGLGRHDNRSRHTSILVLDCFFFLLLHRTRCQRVSPLLYFDNFDPFSTNFTSTGRTQAAHVCLLFS